jgi:hypothetical protein
MRQMLRNRPVGDWTRSLESLLGIVLSCEVGCSVSRSNTGRSHLIVRYYVFIDCGHLIKERLPTMFINH